MVNMANKGSRSEDNEPDRISEQGQHFPKILERSTFLIALIYLIIAMVVFWPAAINPSHVVPATNSIMSDVYQSLWNLWWTNYAIFQAHVPLFFTNRIFYPVGVDLTLMNFMPISGLLTAPLQHLSLALAYNFLLFSSFVLSGIFTYFLAMHFTKDRFCSFLAGLAFSFSAVNIAHAYIFLAWTAVEWIPLFVLFLILMIETRRHRYVVGAAVSFLLIAFMGDFEVAGVTLLFSLAFLYFYAFTESKREILNVRFAVSVLEMLLLILLFGLPLILPTLHSIVYNNTLTYGAEGASIYSSGYWSDDLFSFLLPSEFNGLFNGISSSYQSALSPGGFPWERVSYVGYTLIALVIIGIYYDLKRTGLSRVIVWVSLAVLFAWISLGPMVVILGRATQIPGIYTLLTLVPVFSLIREPGRFDVLVALCTAILAAYGLAYLFERMKIRKYKMKLLLTSVLSALILIECTGFPISNQFVSTLYANMTIPSGYALINSSANATLLELPTLPDPGDTPIAMYYQSVFNDPIIGGYAARATPYQELYPYILPIASMYSLPNDLNNSYYYIRYPVVENYTIANRFLFEKYGIQYVSVAKRSFNYSLSSGYENYNESQLAGIAADIYDIGGSMIYNSSAVELFYVPKWNTTGMENAETAFISGIWLPPMYLSCGDNCPYNVSVWNSLWFIDDYYNDGVEIFSPQAERVTLCASVFPLQNTRLYAYQDGTMIKSTEVAYGRNNYSLALNLSKGYNNITFSDTRNISRPTTLPDVHIQIGFEQIMILHNESNCSGIFP